VVLGGEGEGESVLWGIGQGNGGEGILDGDLERA
jgi:hypothetical protein